VSATNMAKEAVEQEVARRTGWFRPFCLAALVLILVTTCVVGGTVVLLVRNIISLPPGLISALTGGTSPITIQGTTVLEGIKKMSDLTTVRFNYSNLITSQRDLPEFLKALYGDRLVLVAVGYINAGIDLRQMTVDSITTKGDTMTITLPPPQLLGCALDEKASYVVSRDTGLFARPAPNLDQEARRYAVGEFRKAALDNDILSEAQENAKTLIASFVSSLGVKNVNIVLTPPDPNAPLPADCQ
jgi:phosphotransferase system HPr-like phosphotransfer protein